MYVKTGMDWDLITDQDTVAASTIWVAIWRITGKATYIHTDWDKAPLPLNWLFLTCT